MNVAFEQLMCDDCVYKILYPDDDCRPEKSKCIDIQTADGYPLTTETAISSCTRRKAELQK